MVVKAKLYLLPSSLGEESTLSLFTPQLINLVPNLQHYIVENEKTARRFLKFIYPQINQSELQFTILDKRFVQEDLSAIVMPLKEGREVGLLSEAGVPCIADPGNVVVAWCHQQKIPVVPLIGASAIFMALMASGLNGQNFQFHGYLPVNKMKSKAKLKFLEKESARQNKTQIFMETPFRNNKIISTIIDSLQPSTKLCIASQITQSEEFIQTKTIQEWKGDFPDLHKKPTIFLFQS